MSASMSGRLSLRVNDGNRGRGAVVLLREHGSMAIPAGIRFS